MLSATSALAMGGAPSGQEPRSGMFGLFVPLLLMFVVLYIFMIRPAQKKQKEKDRMLNSLKRGDRIVTSGGIYGDIQQVKENTVVVRIADNVKIEMQKGSVSARLSEGDEGEQRAES